MKRFGDAGLEMQNGHSLRCIGVLLLAVIWNVLLFYLMKGKKCFKIKHISQNNHENSRSMRSKSKWRLFAVTPWEILNSVVINSEKNWRFLCPKWIYCGSLSSFGHITFKPSFRQLHGGGISLIYITRKKEVRKSRTDLCNETRFYWHNPYPVASQLCLLSADEGYPLAINPLKLLMFAIGELHLKRWLKILQDQFFSRCP